MNTKENAKNLESMKKRYTLEDKNIVLFENSEQNTFYRIKRRNESGITLVALVVTIVVLLILAGVSIGVMTGENGIFNKAQDTVNKTEIKAFEERLNIANSDAMLNRIKNSGLTPTEYFEILKNYGIISDTAVLGKNIVSEVENKDTSKTYEIISDNGYIFELIIYPNGIVNTEIIGKDGNIEAKVKEIVVINKTQTTIDIRVVARLQGGEIKAYYKNKSEIEENEIEESIEGYTEIILNNKLEGTAIELVEGEEYRIKVILKKDGKVVSHKAIDEIVGLSGIINSITLNKTSIILVDGQEETLIATIKPNNAEEKGLVWESSEPSIATVDQTGKVMAIKSGETIITVTAMDSGKKSATCNVSVNEIPYSWGELEEIAQKISNGEATNQKGEIITNEITSVTTSTKATVEINGIEKTINVGNWKKIDGKRVRILGFNHDTLTANDDYGEITVTGKAGISFEYLDCLDETTKMNSSNGNANGWVTKDLYKSLNTNSRSTYKILKEKGVPIKRVQKLYNTTGSSNAIQVSHDYIWLLSCSEIWGSSAADGYVSGYSMAEEGNQYAYYANCNPKPEYNVKNNNVEHYIDTNRLLSSGYWLRSPCLRYDYDFCFATHNGRCDYRYAEDNCSVCPAFSI